MSADGDRVQVDPGEGGPMRRRVSIAVAIVVAASCIPWIRHQRSYSMLVAITIVVLAGFIVIAVVRALAGWQGKESHRGGKGAFGVWSPRLRNVCVGAALILVLTFTLPHFVATSSGAYRLALETANQTPQFVERLGKPIGEAWFSEGRTQYGNPAKAELTIPVTGAKEKGNLQVIAIRENGDWKLTRLTLELARSGEQIDLLAGSR